MHESVTADGPVGTLTQELQHYSYATWPITSIASTTTPRWPPARCTSAAAGRRAVDLVVQAPAAFLRNYVLRRGFLDGSVGFRCRP